MATNYDINYNDERFTQVESDKSAALSDLEKTYSGMINESDKYYQAQIDASKQWADKQTQLQQEQTDFAIEQIEQQKDQAKKDYTKEQSGAYVDWQKQSNQYGANSEEVAAGGMTNTGFAESSQVSMYNTYQNRVATAREAYGRAVLNYDNAIKDARLQNNSVLAEIAYEALQQQLELSLQGFQYKNTLLLEKANRKTELDQMYYGRYQDVLQQINTENAMAEDVRQYNESMALEREKFAEDQRQFNAQMAEEQRQFEILHGSKSGGSGGSGSSSSKKSSSKKLSGGSSKKKGSSVTTIDKPSTKSKSSESDGYWKTTGQSIMDLGLGPISPKTLDNLVASGKVKETTNKKGITTFKKANKNSVLTRR